MEFDTTNCVLSILWSLFAAVVLCIMFMVILEWWKIRERILEGEKACIERRLGRYGM